jgi:hypothetical protein
MSMHRQPTPPIIRTPAPCPCSVHFTVFFFFLQWHPRHPQRPQHHLHPPTSPALNSFIHPRHPLIRPLIHPLSSFFVGSTTLLRSHLSHQPVHRLPSSLGRHPPFLSSKACQPSLISFFLFPTLRSNPFSVFKCEGAAVAISKAAASDRRRLDRPDADTARPGRFPQDPALKSCCSCIGPPDVTKTRPTHTRQFHGPIDDRNRA